GDEPRDEFGDFNFAFRRSPERCSDFNDLTQTLNDFRRPMSEDQRSPRTDIINVFFPVDVPNMRTVTAIDEERLAADGTERPNRRVHAPWHKFLSTIENLFGFRHLL